ncbi:MAG: hypothetical protein EAY70_12840 [Sphingomonadales bacterium]|nr:MAG: hypothetical protein EAY70_12840 [Sphingomonadales bacterium]
MRDQALEDKDISELADPELQTVLCVLEHQLAALDRRGARMAAAHLDAAIEQLRRDAARG